jgi:hypothetical protein
MRCEIATNIQVCRTEHKNNKCPVGTLVVFI